MIRTNGNWEVFKMMIIKEYPCNSKTELLIEEEKYRKELQSKLNLCMCYRTIEEKLEYNRNYYKNNKITCCDIAILSCDFARKEFLAIMKNIYLCLKKPRKLSSKQFQFLKLNLKI